MKRALFRFERMCGTPRILLNVHPEKLRLTEPIPGEEEFGPRLLLWYPDDAEWAMVSLLSQGCDAKATVTMINNPATFRLRQVKLTVEFRVTPTHVGFLSGLVADYDTFERIAVGEHHPVVLTTTLYGHPDLLAGFAAQLAVSGELMKVGLYAKTEPGMTREVWRASVPVRWGVGEPS